MKKRYEPLQPDPEFIRPDAQPDEGKKSTDDFALHLAASLRAEKQAHEAAAPQRPKPLDLFSTHDRAAEPAAPEAAFPVPDSEPFQLPEDLEAELNELLGREPDAVEPEPEPVDPEAAEPEPVGSEPEPTAARAQILRPGRPEGKLSALRGTEIQPARLEVRPSAQELRTPAPEPEAPQETEALPLVRADLSDQPFAPPEEDPSLEELFRLPGTEDEPPESPAAPPKLVEEIIPEAAEASPTPEKSPEEQPSASPSGGETGPLPTLEELFGTPEEPPAAEPEPETAEPEAPAASPKAPAASPETNAQKPERPSPMNKLRGLLGSLLVSQVPDEPEEEPELVPAKAEAAPLPAVETQPAVEAPPAAEPEHPSEPTTEQTPEPAAEQTPPQLEATPYESIDLAELDALLQRYTQEEAPAASPAEPEPGSETNTVPEAAAVPAQEPAVQPEPECAASPEPKFPEPDRTEPEAPELTLKELFAPEPASSEPEATEPSPAAPTVEAPESRTEPEPATLPLNLAEPTPAVDKKAAQRKKAAAEPPSEKAMTLQELLAAAVPIEDAPPPQQHTPPQPEPPVKQPSRRRKKNRNHAALRESAAAAKVAAAAAAAKAAAAAPLREPLHEAAENVSEVFVPAASVPMESAPQKSHAGDGKKEPAHEPRPTRQSEPPAEPVPSADVRKPTQQPPKRPERSETPAREPEPRPKEEPAVLHPEEAFRLYARPLDELGTRLILTGLFAFVSLFFTLYLTRHWTFLPEIFSGGTTVYIQLGLLGLTFLICRKPLFRKLRKTHGLHPALLLLFAAIFTALDCLSAAKTLRSPLTPVYCALSTIFLWGEYDRFLGLTTTVKVLRAEAISSGVSEVPDIAKGSRGLVRTQPNVDRFMEKLETRDLTERAQRIFTPIAAVSALALTLLIGIGLKQDVPWTGSLLFLGAVPTAGLLAYPRLYLQLSRRLAETDAALCGYYGAEVFGGEHSILIGDEDIFPTGSLTLNGFKVYSGNPDRIIAYAAAAVRSSGSALDPVFDDLLVTHNGRHYDVDTFRYYDSGGIGASIDEDVILMGSLDFMRRMGVHMDKGARVRQAVYLSLNGELAAVFAIRYAPPENLRKGLASIAANRHFKGILVTRTFLGTPAFLKAKFGIPAGTFLYPSTSERIRLSEAELKRAGAQGAILAKNSFSGFAQAAAGGRMLRSATIGAAILTILSGIVGLLLMGVLAALKAQETATALNLLLYVAVWLAPTLLLSVWGRHF